MIDLFADNLLSDPIKPVRPIALGKTDWPPDYKGVLAWRIRQLQRLRADPQMLEAAMLYYSTRPSEFIMHWMDTFDPRRTDNKWIPFIFFERQVDLVDFLHECRNGNESGLIEKCRDAGATWVSCAYSIWSWTFIPSDAIGWGSRKAELVDRIGNADSIFEKLRLLVHRMPSVFKPEGFSPRNHATYMRLINPANGAVITGESGDNIGRGGRSSIYFKDEAAFYERPEKIEAALGDNTNVQIDISSVNGLGNVFHRRRKDGVEWYRGADLPRGAVRVFTFDWADHPAKTQEWYDTRRAKAEREGMLHIFASEVERNYAAAVSNTIISKEWIQAAVDAHMKVASLIEAGVIDRWGAGLDVADQGTDRNAIAFRQGIIVREVEEWGERDVGVTTRRAVLACRNHMPLKVQYDSVGLGAGVKSEYNRLCDTGDIDKRRLIFVPWNAGAKVQKPFARVIPDDLESPTNKAMFFNLKAQAWWDLRTRFYKTYRAVKDGIYYPADELISLDSRMPLLHQLINELAQPTKGDSSTLQMLVNKKPEGEKSPNLADAVVMCMFPVDDENGKVVIGTY